MSGTADALQREKLRQQMLLRALWRDGSAAQAWHGWIRGLGAGADAGLAAYRGNAAAIAARALAAAFPTIAALVGEESFAALARDFWRTHPPSRGDLGEWGGALPAFIAHNAQLADEPYLADSAALDWRVHLAARAADAVDAGLPLQALAEADPARITLRLAPGAALVNSAWPIASIWRAHQRPAADPDRFADARVALAEHRAETALVWRDPVSYAVQVAAQDAADNAFTQALIDHTSLAAALDAAAPSFAFDRWLAAALASRRLAGIHALETCA
jgi:hypothetical protein